MKLNCIAIDDEPPSLDLLCRFINQTPFLKLVESFSNGLQSLQYLNENQIDLIFLDIQMPYLNGVELARVLLSRGTGSMPAIIFTTAFDKFAMEGYKLNVTDYLLKPFTYEEFLKAANKALKWTQLQNLVEGQSKDEDCIYLRFDSQTAKIVCRNISYIESFKDYAKFHFDTSENSIQSLITLKMLEEKLPKGQFMRIHRSFIIRLDKVTSVTKNSVYIGKLMFPVSDPFRDEFNKFVSKWT